MESMSLAALEQIRLLLRGGSVVDWFRLRFEDAQQVSSFLSLLGADDDDPRDLARLDHIRDQAAAYLTDEHGYRIPPDLLACEAVELFLFASEKRGRRRDRFFACLLLKVMHIIHHIDARELRFRLPISQRRLSEMLLERIQGFATGLSSDGFPLVRFSGGLKSSSSLITKLLVKREHHAAAIHDRVRARFVVQRPHDLVTLLHRMTTSLFPFNYVAPAQTVNQLVNFTAFVESHAAYRVLGPDLQLELGQEEQGIGTLNEFSGPTYRVINFVVDIPLRVPEELVARAPQDGEDRGRVVFVLAEFQLVDEATDADNEQGENRHERYRTRQLGIVRERLEKGKRSGRDEER